MRGAVLLGSIKGDGAFSLPLGRIVTSRIALLGSTGCGKSNALGVIIESVADNRIPFCLLDTEGEHGLGLKTRYDSLLYAGFGNLGDIKNIEVVHAEPLAKTLVENNLSAVIDLGGASRRMKRQFVARFVSSLFQAHDLLWKKGDTRPRLLAVEETHNFCPQTVTRHAKFASESMDAIETVAAQGRKRGIGLLVASQRPAKFNKDVLAMCDIWALMWTGWPGDADTLSEFVGGKRGLRAYGLPDFRELSVGDAIVAGKPEILAHPLLIHFNKRITPYGGGTPEVIVRSSPSLNRIIKRVSLQLASLRKRAQGEASLVKRLRAKVRLLEERLAEKEEELERLRTAKEVVKLIKIRPEIEPVKVQMPVPATVSSKDTEVTVSSRILFRDYREGVKALLGSEECYREGGFTMREIGSRLRRLGIPFDGKELRDWMYRQVKSREIRRTRAGKFYRYWWREPMERIRADE